MKEDHTYKFLIPSLRLKTCVKEPDLFSQYSSLCPDRCRSTLYLDPICAGKGHQPPTRGTAGTGFRPDGTKQGTLHSITEKEGRIPVGVPELQDQLLCLLHPLLRPLCGSRLPLPLLCTCLPVPNLWVGAGCPKEPAWIQWES